ncbi:MAG: LuxR C-terminal-related transcriptional regulator [bacterium]
MHTDSQNTTSTSNYMPAENNHILAMGEKLKEAKKFVEKVKDRIAENPDTCYYAYKTFVGASIESFFEFIFASPDSDINWEDPGYELHYNVNIDKNLNRVDFIVNESHVKDEETFNKKLTSVFVYIHNVFLLDALSRDTVAFKQGENYKYLINSEKILDEVGHIYNRYEKSKRIIELTHHKIHFPFHFNKLNNRKALIQTLSGKLTVEFVPLTVDKEKYMGHYPIIVSLSCDQSLNNFCIEEKREILQKILESVRTQVLYEDESKTPVSKTEQNKEFLEISDNFIEMGFTGKLLIDKSLKSDFIGGNTLQIKVNRLHVQEKPQQKLTFNKPKVKLTEDEERFLVLYAKEGIKNYAKIAEKMFCSEQTVKNWAQSVQYKLRANNIPQAIYLYFVPNSEDLSQTLY